MPNPEETSLCIQPLRIFLKIREIRSFVFSLFCHNKNLTVVPVVNATGEEINKMVFKSNRKQSRSLAVDIIFIVVYLQSLGLADEGSDSAKSVERPRINKASPL